MKNKRKIFGLINLVLFLASFCFTVFSIIKFNFNSNFNHTAYHFVGKTSGSSQDTSQQLSENNENEYEDDSDLEINHIQLPFFFSFNQFTFLTSCFKPTQIIAMVYPKPIYLAIQQILI
ncbi:MAG: hypothetical protein WCR21_07705 [Bacteroidota bacterium]